MTRKNVLISAGVFLVFLLVGWLAGVLLTPGQTGLWVLRGIVWALGAIAALLTWFYLAARARAAGGAGETKGAVSGQDDIHVAIAAAETRLAASRLPGPRKLSGMPLVLVVGPTGAAKTSTVKNSGIEAELLAGEVENGGLVATTRSLNLWYTQGTVFVEAGGSILDEPVRWARFARAVRPGRLAAVFSRGSTAPRQVVVCFPCDEFLKPGNAESVPAAARQIRERLAEVSRTLGVRLPVYVVFTKLDRLPFFEDFARGMTRDEAREALGTTLPAVENPDVGAYAERETARISAAFAGIHRSLSLRRLAVLPREQEEEGRAGGYEFPRELGKISGLATDFLVEICRPRQLGVNPFLRGFYFSGVRAVLVNDLGAGSVPDAPRPRLDLGATTVFRPEQHMSPSTPVTGGSRKIPEWAFLQRIFPEVVLVDRNAKAVTAGGRRVNLPRRLSLGLVTGGLLLAGVYLGISFTNNRQLTTEAFAAARAVEGITPRGDDLASADALVRLDELRSRTSLLRKYQQDGHPWGFGLGLYTGNQLLAELRRLYFDRFERVLWADTRGRLMGNMRGLSDTPGANEDYGAVYNMLKAHLVTTSQNGYSTGDFLGPVLLDQWTGGMQVDEQRTALALRQFAFYGSELPLGNPYDLAPEDATIARTRVLLQGFSNLDQFYQAMVSDVSAHHPSVEFAREFPNAAPLVTNPYIVPGAYTAAGWETVQANLADVNRLFDREDWVVGERAVSPEDRVRLARELRTRYVSDYVAQWREYLRAGNLVRGSDIPSIGQALTRLSGNESPLLEMLALASRNTNVDSTTVATAFQPLHRVVPPTATDRFINDANAPYIAALADLQGAFNQVATATGPLRDQAMGAAIAGTEKVRSEVRTMALDFKIDGEASLVGTTIQTLLQAPFAGTESLLGGLPSAEINTAGASFCTPFRQITSRYPFSSQATTEASVADVNALFQRGSSALWAFYDDVLQGLIARQGTRYAARVGATPQPSAAFVQFFSRAAEFSEAVYDERGAGPAVTFLLRAQTSDALPEITINIDGQAQTFTRTFSSARPFTWQGDRARLIRISANVNNSDVTLLEGAGTWGVFRLFQTASWEPLGGDRYLLRWRLPGNPSEVTAELTMNPGTPPIFQAGYFNQLSCVSRIVG
ncbi:MAG: hypothetical protein LBG44_02105 [Gemmatimonadota bacterium]|nr:hypothetical protein [Gemmatimonadota bacterium]